MKGDIPEESIPEELTGKFVEEAVFFVVNWHAATVNMRLYPPTSSMVTETVDKARAHLDNMLDQSELFAVSVLENNLLINDVRLEEIEQQKAPVRSFVQWMSDRGLTSLEFRLGVTPEEVGTVFEVLSAPPDHRINLSDVLLESGVTNVTLNQRVYVAISSGEEGDGIRRASPLDALKDELLMRYLMGKVDLGSVQDKELIEVLSDSAKVGGLLSTFIREEGSEGGVLVRSQKAEEALSRLSEMVDQVEDEQLRAILSEQIGGIISEMTPREMTSVLTGDSPETLNLAHLREHVLTMLGDKELLEMVDSLISDYMDMKTESDELEDEWQRDKLRNLNTLLIEMREERGEELAEVVDRKLEAAGIVEERDPETGRKILSAYQLLGGPIEEEFVELAEGIDQTVSEQIHRLYSMEERELAGGMLEKLVENLRQESPKVRRFAAQLVKETLDTLEREHQLAAAGVLEAQLLADVRAETDYAAYIPQVDSVSVLARAYMQEGLADESSDIVELLKEQSGPEAEKGPELVKYAAAVLERLTGPEGMVDAQSLLQEEDLEKRLATVRALAGLGPSALAPLIDLVKDRGQVELRERALETLKASGEVGTRALLAELDTENPWYIYRNVLNVIAELRLVDAAGRVADMLNHPDERIRREAVRSLARIGAKESVESVMASAVGDQSPAVRRTAVRVLGMFSDASVAVFLTDLMNGQGPRGRDEDQAVVEAACLALGDLKNADHVPQLVDLLAKGGLFKKARPDEIRAAACIALGSIGDPAVIPHLEKAARDQSMMVRSSAEKALRKVTGKITVPEQVTPEEEREMGAEAEAPRAADTYRALPHPESLAPASTTGPEPPEGRSGETMRAGPGAEEPVAEPGRTRAAGDEPVTMGTGAMEEIGEEPAGNEEPAGKVEAEPPDAEAPEAVEVPRGLEETAGTAPLQSEPAPLDSDQNAVESGLESLLGTAGHAPGTEPVEVLPAPEPGGTPGERHALICEDAPPVEAPREPAGFEALAGPEEYVVPGRDGPPEAEPYGGGTPAPAPEPYIGEEGLASRITGAELEAELEPFLREEVPDETPGEPVEPEAPAGFGGAPEGPPEDPREAGERLRAAVTPEWPDVAVPPGRQQEAEPVAPAAEKPAAGPGERATDHLAEEVEPQISVVSEDYAPPPIPPDDIYIDNLAGEEGVFLVHDPEEQDQPDSRTGYETPVPPPGAGPPEDFAPGIPEPPYAARQPEPETTLDVEPPPERQAPPYTPGYTQEPWEPPAPDTPVYTQEPWEPPAPAPPPGGPEQPPAREPGQEWQTRQPPPQAGPPGPAAPGAPAPGEHTSPGFPPTEGSPPRERGQGQKKSRWRK